MLYVDPIQAGHVSLAERGVPAGAREKKALQEFERIFLFQMLREMRKGISETNLFGHESQREIFTEMLDDVFAGQMAESGQLGIAGMMAAQLRIAESQAEIRQNLADTRARRRSGSDVPGLPLHPPAGIGLPLQQEPAKGLPFTRPGDAWLEIPGKGNGLPLTQGGRSSGAAKLPINTTGAPGASGPGRPGTTQ